LDWSDDWLRFPTDVADSFDLNEGDMAIVLAAETEGVNKPLLDIEETVVAAVEGVEVLTVEALLAENDEGGDFPLRNCLGVFRKLNGVRPRRFSEGLGDSLGSPTGKSDSFERPENERPPGVDALRNTANRYRSTTPRAKRLVLLTPLRSSPSASMMSQSSSSSSFSVRSPSPSPSERKRSRAATPDFSRRPRTFRTVDFDEVRTFAAFDFKSLAGGGGAVSLGGKAGTPGLPREVGARREQ
jgi:hypothetical protein